MYAPGTFAAFGYNDTDAVVAAHATIREQVLSYVG